MIMQQAPKENRAPGEPPVCSTGRGGVALDVIMAALLGAGALVALANDEPGAGLGVGTIGGVYAYSAVSGHRAAQQCEEAREDYQLEIAARRSEPQPRREPAAPTAAAPVARPAGPPIEAAAPPEADAPPVEEAVAEPEPEPPAAEPAPAAAPVPRDWSDFWVEVAR